MIGSVTIPPRLVNAGHRRDLSGGAAPVGCRLPRLWRGSTVVGRGRSIDRVRHKRMRPWHWGRRLCLVSSPQAYCGAAGLNRGGDTCSRRDAATGVRDLRNHSQEQRQAELQCRCGVVDAHPGIRASPTHRCAMYGAPARPSLRDVWGTLPVRSGLGNWQFGASRPGAPGKRAAQGAGPPPAPRGAASRRARG